MYDDDMIQTETSAAAELAFALTPNPKHSLSILGTGLGLSLTHVPSSPFFGFPIPKDHMLCRPFFFLQEAVKIKKGEKKNYTKIQLFFFFLLFVFWIWIWIWTETEDIISYHISWALVGVEKRGCDWSVCGMPRSLKEIRSASAVVVVVTRK